MTRWTPEQLEAIEKTGSNIIVSAGAGSGKTAVLSQRVIDKLEKGIHINELLILTFTEAAASEMKNRIRKKISSDIKYKDELNLLNSSYITTFDSFALSVVKRYHYLLNISSDIAITDESLVRLEQNKIIDDIFEELYYLKDENFLRLIDKYCIKNDRLLRENILTIASKISSLIDYDDYLDNICNNYFSDENINNIISDYVSLIESKKAFIRSEIDNLNYYFDASYVDSVYDSVNSLLSSSVDELPLISKVSLPRVPNGTSEEAKIYKNNLKSSIDDLLSFNVFGTTYDIRNTIIDSRSTIETIIMIVRKYIDRINKYKKENNIYTFSDIASLSIKILREFEEARNELKYSFKEIMIDEYQDTNDVQDTFIKLIENNNVYMVGDIKQSIYKFRGSNPNIFKDKYDNYSNNNGGYKIDLIKNFRSRNEVLDSINKVFELLMDDIIGGASYKVSHEMVYGNTSYDEEGIKDYDYSLEVLNYTNDKDSGFNNNEVEIFLIADDIKNKVKSKFKVFDKDTSKMRSVKYSDFCIILDRSVHFDTFKKVFEYLGIPLTILKDETLNSSTDLLLIRNIIDLIIRINNNDFDVGFKYDFVSIARSFIYEYSDTDIYDIVSNNKYKDTSIYKDFISIDSINSKTNSEILNDILEITNFYSKLSKIGNYENTNVRINTIYNISNGLNNIGFGLEEFVNYLNDIIENGIDISYSGYVSSDDSVKLMTIHKSKGLEYPVCYYSDLDHKFNLSDINKLFIVDNNYGLIVPNVLNDNDKSVIKELYKNNYIKEEISERLRLFYVALTRAREKMIIVLPSIETIKLDKDENGVIELPVRLNIKKLSDFVYSIKDYLPKYFKDVDISKIGLTKDYLFKKKNVNKIKTTTEDFNVEEINIINEVLESSHFSKENNQLLELSNFTNMKYGSRIHEILELLDFKNYDLSIIDDELIKSKINSFINSDLLKDKSWINEYHEYEFKYTLNNTIYHGVIDLMLEYSDHIDIIDYKLKNINDTNYLEQLNGYKKYISSISDKKVNIYLYSLIDEKIESLM